MPLTAPNLDSRTFEQLVAEVRRRIPTFTPEWTDFNDSDPGITIAQLFAFMSEQLLFQINQVPDKGLVTFLKMVGAELHAATPATADITITPLAGVVGTSVTLDAGTRVQTAGAPPGQSGPVTFETTRALRVVNGSLADVVTRGCDMAYASQKAANAAAAGSFRPFGSCQGGGEALYLAFRLNDPAAPWPAGAFRLRVDVAGSSDVGEPDAADDAGAPPTLSWALATGVTSGAEPSLLFSPLAAVLDSTRGFSRSGYVDIEIPPGVTFFKAPGDSKPDLFRGLFVVRVTPTSADALGAEPPRLSSVRLNTVPARHVLTVRGERVGSSTGLPSQRFRLASSPVVPGSVSLSIDESASSGGLETWVETDDLFAAGPNDRVFELVAATGELVFGDGKNGRVPPPDVGTEGGNILAASYQIGGGREGNVGAGTLTRLLPPAGVSGAFDATNVLPARGGDDEEPMAQGIARAPAVVRSRYRAVTVEDFEALAREAPGARVARALALPATRADLEPGTSPGAVTLVLVPHVAYEDAVHAPIRLPSFVSSAVRCYLDRRRLLTCEVYTRAASFRRVTASVSLILEPGAGAEVTRAIARDSLERYFHPLEGGEEGEGWPFGGPVYFSRVFAMLLRVPGVQRVESLSLQLDDCAAVTCGDLPIKPGELLFSGNHAVVARAPR